MHRFVVAKATMESANPSLMFKLEIEHQVLLHLVALPCCRCYFAIQVENAQQKILKKKKKNNFFFSFSSMKSISSHFGGKRNFFCSEIIYTKTGMYMHAIINIAILRVYIYTIRTYIIYVRTHVCVCSMHI